jgi:predicted dehydrogenase
MYNVVFAGCGRISDLHALGYRDFPKACLYGLYDIDQAKAGEKAAQYGVSKIYPSFEAVLSDPKVHMVEILTPHHLHCAMARETALAGKHVSVQKPMALNVDEATQMIDAAVSTGVMLRVYENFVYYPPYVKARQLIESGEIGDPLSFNLRVRCGTGKDAWNVPADAWVWRFNPELGGGCPIMFDHGYHNSSLAIYMLGEVEKVSAFMDRQEVMPGSNIFTSTPAAVMWKYRTGKTYGMMDVVMAPELQIDTRHYADESRLEITGTRGIIFVNRCTGKLQNRPAVELYRDGVTTAFEDIPVEWETSFIHATRDFIDCLDRGTQPQLSGPQGRAVLEFTLAAIEAAETQATVILNRAE